MAVNASEALNQIRDVRELLKTAAAMEQKGVEGYNRWAMESAATADAIAKRLIERVTADEERHFDRYDAELGRLENFGESDLVLQSLERFKAAASGTEAQWAPNGSTARDCPSPRRPSA